MKVLVTGGRDYTDLHIVTDYLCNLGPTVVCQGGARGADALAKQWAEHHGVRCVQFDAQWDTYGKRAGIVRNQLMLDEFKPDVVLAFPGGRGTAHMVTIARRAGVQVIEAT